MRSLAVYFIDFFYQLLPEFFFYHPSTGCYILQQQQFTHKIHRLEKAELKPKNRSYHNSIYFRKKRHTGCTQDATETHHRPHYFAFSGSVSWLQIPMNTGTFFWERKHEKNITRRLPWSTPPPRIKTWMPLCHRPSSPGSIMSPMQIHNSMGCHN